MNLNVDTSNRKIEGKKEENYEELHEIDCKISHCLKCEAFLYSLSIHKVRSFEALKYPIIRKRT